MNQAIALNLDRLTWKRLLWDTVKNLVPSLALFLGIQKLKVFTVSWSKHVGKHEQRRLCSCFMWDKCSPVRSLTTPVSLRTRSFNEIIELLKKHFSPPHQSLFEDLYFTNKINSLVRTLLLILQSSTICHWNLEIYMKCYGSIVSTRDNAS